MRVRAKSRWRSIWGAVSRALCLGAAGRTFCRGEAEVEVILLQPWAAVATIMLEPFEYRIAGAAMQQSSMRTQVFRVEAKEILVRSIICCR